MEKQQRLDLIKKIQEKRKSVVITYFTSTRQNSEVIMAMDQVRIIFDHLLEITKDGKKNIDLFICSNGGDGTVPWKLVTLLREYSTKLSVLVPFRAFSAATLTALGADEIIMHPMGMLGPTDPTVSNDFNPNNPTNPQQKLGISVEDVTAYINLIKEDAGINHDDELVQAFNKLPDHIHPLALGNVKRSLSQSRMMAKKLLALHMDSAKNQHDIEEIIENLTSKLYFHGHPINRLEAKNQIGIRTVGDCDKELEGLIWELFTGYETIMKLKEPFNPVFEFIKAYPSLTVNKPELTEIKESTLAIIESTISSDFNVLKYQITGVKQPNGVINTQLSTLFQGWTKN